MFHSLEHLDTCSSGAFHGDIADPSENTWPLLSPTRTTYNILGILSGVQKLISLLRRDPKIPRKDHGPGLGQHHGTYWRNR